jgi:ubiquinol-cytochrome c reductase iron-sulfur subunit
VSGSVSRAAAWAVAAAAPLGLASGGVLLIDEVNTVAAVAAGGLASMFVLLVGVLRHRLPEEPESQARHLPGHHGYPSMAASPSRRRLLGRGASAAGLAVVAVVLVPAWRATRRAERRLARTSWRSGVRVVDARGVPIRSADLEVGAFTTVWPEGHMDAPDSQAVLIRLRPDRRVTGPGRDDWVVDGNVAYSKLCTHMGCSVGLYQSRSDLLVCPCHQATFDVLRGAAPVHGPAHRQLPQLPLAVDGDGYLVAIDDFPDAVGPGYWSRPA